MDIVKKIKNYTYNERHCLGEGSFGRVYEGRSDQGLKVAIKKVQQSMISKDPYLRSSLQTQINIMKKLNHPNIAKLFDVVITTNSIYLIMQFCSGGDLKRYCRNRKISEDQATMIIKQISKGFQQIVQISIIHRDLKPANILVHEGLFKICDFGFAKFFNDASRMTRTCVGTPIYMSPQVLCQKHYTDKTDVWSLGILYYQLLFGKLPYYGTTEDALYKNIIKGPLPIPNCTNFTASLLRGMLEIDELKRYSWSKIFEIFNFAPLNMNTNQNVKSFFEQGIQPGQIQNIIPSHNVIGFYKPVQIKKQIPNNNYTDREQYEPVLLNNYRQIQGQKYTNIQIQYQDKKTLQRKPKNPLAFQNILPPVPTQNNKMPNQTFEQKNQQAQINPNLNPNINLKPRPSSKEKQPQMIPTPQIPTFQNPRFLYFALVQLIINPIKNSLTYPQLISALYRRCIDLYIKQIQIQKSNKNTLYNKVLSSQYEQLKSIQGQIPNFINIGLEKAAELVLKQIGNIENCESSAATWVGKIVNKNYSYER